MSVYTVHEPPQRFGAAPDAERFAFVRDGFSFWAFLFAPLWMLWHRMWLVLIGYVAILGCLEAMVGMFGGSALIGGFISLLISLLVGLEAGTLRRFTLNRRGWKSIGVVSGDTLEDAERRFFDAWVGRTGEQPVTATAAQPTRSAQAAPAQRTSQAPDVVGLFPEPEARR
jgi:predicted lipid-binding transport protein (Tim44 family)